MNICGFILAAGEGTRLRPATLTRPKALVPFCGDPLLELAGSVLHEAGLEQIIVNAHYQGDRVYEACQRLTAKHGWNISVSSEPMLLNQGGGLRQGIKLAPDTEHFLVHNVDIIVDYDLKDWDGLRADFVAYMAERYPGSEIALNIETEFV